MARIAGAETRELLDRYRRTGDVDARGRLVSNYVPLVKSLCRRFDSAREPQEDLFQVGVIGLLNAIEKFDSERGNSFSSLAIPEVLGSILNHLRDHGSLLKVPRSLRRNKLVIDKVSEKLTSTLGRWPTVAELAESCELSKEEVQAAFVLGRIGEPRSLDESFNSEDADDAVTLSEYVGHEDQEFDLSLDRLTLATALDTLPHREKRILKLRFLRELSQRQIAERIDISQMHVSRLERSALRKLKLVLQRSSAALSSGGQDTGSYGSRLPAAS